MRIFFALMLLPLLNGCLSVCQKELFYQPSVAVDKQILVPRSGDKTLEYKVSEDLVIRVQDWSDTANNIVRIHFRLAPRIGKTIKWTSSTFTALTWDDQYINTFHIDTMEYVVSFILNKNGSYVSNSNPESGVLGMVQEREVFRMPRSYQMSYSFSTALPFSGVIDTNSPIFGRALQDNLNWREYTFSIDMPALGQDEFKIQLPQIEIEGVNYQAPTFTFKKVTKNICSPGV